MTCADCSSLASLQKVGKSLVISGDNDKTLVASLMTMKNRLDTVIATCFDGNEKFMQAEKDAFDHFVNTRANKPAELIGMWAICVIG